MSSISITGSDSGATAGLTDAELRATPVHVDGTHTPADGVTTPTDATSSESYNMTWNPTTSRWSRWGAYSVDDDSSTPSVPGIAIFGRPNMGLGETVVPVSVVSPLNDSDEGFHGLRVVSSDLYRDGTSPVVGRQSDGSADANSKHVVGLVAPVVFNGTTFDRLRSGTALGSMKVDASGAAVPVTDNSGSLTVDSPQLPAALAANGGIKVEGIVGGVAQPVSGPLTDTQLRATAVPVSGPLTDTQLRATAVPVSGTVTASGPLTDTQLRATAVPVSGPLTDTQLRATAVPVSGTVTASGPLTDTQLRATAVPVSGTVTANAGSGTFTVKDARAATVAQTSVASNASSVTVLASNANRLGATIYNDSTQILYLKLGATASSSSFSVAMAAASYYEVPFNYTGIIDGIWASANGNARITELTA